VQEQERRRIRRSGFAIENIEAIDFDGTIENRPGALTEGKGLAASADPEINSPRLAAAKAPESNLGMHPLSQLCLVSRWW
jgi:hypothetical protein